MEDENQKEEAYILEEVDEDGFDWIGDPFEW